MFTTRPELVGTRGMVASTHWLASSAGMAVLEDGGNAFDAAVAAGFVLQVAEPHLNGPAGQVPALFATASNRTPRVLCGQGVAPAAATPEYYADLGLDLIPGSGLLSATVPGAWDAWLLLLRDHGTKRLRDVLSYAISYAWNGVPVVPTMTQTIDSVAELFAVHWPSSARLWLPAGETPAPGSLHRNPTLARTWQRLLGEAEQAQGREAQIDAARRAWSHGFVAETIGAFCETAYRDDSGAAHAGLLTAADLASWEATYEDAVITEFDDCTLVKCGPWTQGPVLAQQLRLLEGFRDELSYVDGVPTAATIHLATECAKLAFADREAWYGDTGEVDLDLLLSADYAAQRRKLVGDTACAELRPGGPAPVLPKILAETLGGQPAMGPHGEPVVNRAGTTRGDTVHIDVVDADGNMVSATPSGGWLQSSPTIPELGFCLDSRAQMFWLEQGLPNSLAPGKRPRITLSPSMTLRGGEPTLAFGTPGGDQQDQWQLCFLLAHKIAEMNLQQAIDAPAWHSTAFPSSFYPRPWTERGLVVESRVGEPVLAQLADRGHDIVVAGPWELGRLSAVSRDPASGILRAAANARGMQGYAVGR